MRSVSGVSERGSRSTGPSTSSIILLNGRSEEHTSELQSQSNLVCRLLLEKKKLTRLTEAISVSFKPRPEDTLLPGGVEVDGGVDTWPRGIHPPRRRHERTVSIHRPWSPS